MPLRGRVGRSHTHTHTHSVCVITTGFQARSRGGKWSWAAKVGLLSFQVVPQQQCNGHCPGDSAQARQLKQQLCIHYKSLGNGEGTPP